MTESEGVESADKERIAQLEGFKDLVLKWDNARSQPERQATRTQINQQTDQIREIVGLAGCLQTLTISPPPAVGGIIMRNVDPFDYVFEKIYGMSMQTKLFDMIDKSVGVIASGKFGKRAESIAKTRGPMGPVSGNKVFLVHGHDEAAKESTARFLERLQLEPVILHEQVNAGRTIIEKVEHYSGVAVAVVLLTPDDVGSKAGVESQSPRARQNVILELGYFLGRLGRSRVIAILKGDVEKPSDYDGVLYIPLDAGGAWKLQLAKELKGAGLNIDMNDAA